MSGRIGVINLNDALTLFFRDLRLDDFPDDGESVSNGFAVGISFGGDSPPFSSLYLYSRMA